MKKGRYLNEREREAIDAQHKHDTLYMLMRSIAPEAEELNKDSLNALSGEDLFYLVMKFIDAFIDYDDPHDPDMLNETQGMWLNFKQRLREESSMSDDELTAASTLVILTARECLRRGDMWQFWDICDALALSVTSHDTAGWEQLLPIINEQWQKPMIAQRYSIWWQQYCNSAGWLSDELDELLLDVRRSAPQTPDIEHKAEIVAGLGIFFKDDAARAERFLLAIYQKNDLEVTAEIKRLKRTKEIDLDRKIKALHTLLSCPKYGLYNASYMNFSSQLKT